MSGLRAFFALAWLTVASAAAAEFPWPPAVGVEGLGVNIHFTDPRPGELEMLNAAGFRWVRMDFKWEATEPERGRYDFAAYERLLAGLDRFGLRAVFILDYGHRQYGENSAVLTEEGRQAFARWAAAAVQHFAGRGILWEIWNEPNGGFWKPHADGQQYVALALAASKAMRAAAPAERIIGPATSLIDFPFLESCFKAGLLTLWDAVSVHPYRQTAPETVAREYQKLRRLIAQYAPAGKTIPILSGEWGFSSAWLNFDAEKQGRMLPREVLTNFANGIPLSIWYDWYDDGPDPQEAEHHFGTVEFAYRADRDPVYEPKPAYRAAQTLSAMLAGCTFVKRLVTSGSEDFALLFKKGDELRLAVWTASPTPHPIVFPSAKSPLKAVSHLGEMLPNPPNDGGVCRVLASNAPQYLSFAKGNAPLLASPAAHPLSATILPTSPTFIGAHIENLGDSPLTGTARLFDGGKLLGEQPLIFAADEAEKTLTFPLRAELPASFRAALRIERARQTVFDLPAQEFRALPADLFLKCKPAPDGDVKVAGDGALTPAPAPEPLPESTAPVAKIDYHFGAGWKFLELRADRVAVAIEGDPKAFGLWLYGDGKRLVVRLRVTDAQGTTWQPTAGEIT